MSNFLIHLVKNLFFNEMAVWFDQYTVIHKNNPADHLLEIFQVAVSNTFGKNCVHFSSTVPCINFTKVH